MERIQWVMAEGKGKNSCKGSRAEVMKDCPVCGQCSESSACDRTTAKAAIAAGVPAKCMNYCSLGGFTTSCLERIEWVMKNGHKTCQQALTEVAKGCPMCQQCPESGVCAYIAHPPKGCKAMCKRGGKVSTCGDRLLWISQEITNDADNICKAAGATLMRDYPECAGCTPDAAGCETNYSWHWARKYDTMALQGEDGQTPVLATIGLMMVAAGVFGLFGLVAVRAHSRPGSIVESDALLVVEDPSTDA